MGVDRDERSEGEFTGLIEPDGVDRSELHGFEMDMSGRVVVPEFQLLG